MALRTERNMRDGVLVVSVAGAALLSWWLWELCAATLLAGRDPLVARLMHFLFPAAGVLSTAGCSLLLLRRQVGLRERLQDECARAHDELAKAQEERARLSDSANDLRRRAADLAAANKELESFSYTVSHDLRTPLTRIYSAVQALLEFTPDLSDDGRYFARTVKEGCEQMNELIEALLVLGRVSRVELCRGPVDLSAAARRIAVKLGESAPQREVAFRITPDLCVEGDPQMLQVVLENLMENAWKYTTGKPHPLIEFGALGSAEGETVFFLKDNGAGFDMGRAGQLFQPFCRLHSTAQFPGNGVGLATVRRIIERHQGRVWGEGEEGAGAIFYFTVG